MWFDIGLIVSGILMLYGGGNVLITSSIRIAHRFKINPFVIGATIIAFGTSAPELVVSIFATLKDAPEVALGNVIGSNIANICLVLGLTSLFGSITVSKETFQTETPPLLIATVIIVFLAWDQKISRWEGIFLLLWMTGYLWLVFLKKENNEEIEELGKDKRLLENAGTWVQLALIVIGLICLTIGANWLVKGAVNIARSFGISEWLIGITIVALGTSLPEIFSTLIASFRGQHEMSLGNIYGSNIFNINLVIGTTSTIKPLQIATPIHTDLGILFFLTFLLAFLIRPKLKLVPAGGVLLLICYILYITLKSLQVI